MIRAGIKFGSNHFERQAKGLNAIDSIAPRCAGSVRPADGPFAIPRPLSFNREADLNLNLHRLIVFKES